MRKHAFTATIAALVAATCIALTGCTPEPPGSTDDDSLVETDWQVHFNRESGKITAIFDHEDPTREIYRDKTFDQKEDLALPFAYELAEYSSGNRLEGVFPLSGRDYPTTVGVYWSLGSTNWEAQAIYYNKHIASAETVAELSGKKDTEEDGPKPPQDGLAFSLTTVVLDFIGEGVMATPAPTPRFGTTGEATILLGPDILVDGYANGVPAEVMVEQLTGEPADPNGRYTYTFGCATYEIALQNGEEIQAWIDGLAVNTDGVQIGFDSNVTKALVDTEAPCDISVQDPLNTPTPDNPGTEIDDPVGGSTEQNG